MPVRSDNKDERTAAAIVRIILLLVAVFFLIYAFFIKVPCDSDKIFLSCRLTGTWADWIGGFGFFAGLLWMSGIVRGVNNLFNPPTSSQWNLIWLIIMILSVVLFWNL